MDHPSEVIVVRGGIHVRRLHADELAGVLAALDVAEAESGAPLVDEAERERLVGAARTDGATWPPGWTPIVAGRGSSAVGYAAYVAEGGGRAAPERSSQDVAQAGAPPDAASGDAAALTADPARAVLGALLAALRTLADEVGLRDLQVWVRQGGEREVDVAAAERFTVGRRLGVLGRYLDELPPPVEPVGHTIRAYRPEQDDAGVVEVLAAAYEGTDEAGWDAARFQERRELPWFRAEDLLVAEDEQGRLGGLHWLKRRDTTTGEVYNLAVHPRAQGRRLGPALLSAGLHHLGEVGCTEVVLWVDRANERAVRLYEGQGFTTRWDDLAFRLDPA